MIRPYIKGDVLDFGCGPAKLLDMFGDQIESYFGIDKNEELLSQNRNRFPDAEFMSFDLDQERFDVGKRFDAVVMAALIEHIFNQKTIFQNAISQLKEGGAIIITTPTPFGNDIVHSFGSKIGLFARSAADDHIVIYNRKRLEILCDELNLKLTKYRTFQFCCNQLAILTRK